MTWTIEKIDRLRFLWSDGWTCSQIGADIGKSRNAVIGKVHRMRLDGRATAERAPYITLRADRKPKDGRRAYKRHETPSVAKAAGVVALKPQEPVLGPPIGPGVPLIHATGCLFSIANATDGMHLFCNGPKHHKSAWCEYHYRIVYARSPDRTGKPFQKQYKIPVTMLRAVA